MEFLLTLVVLFFGGAILRAIFAGGKSVVTGKTFKESYRGIDDFSARLNNSFTKTESGQSFNVRKAEIKGLLPIDRKTNLTALLSVVDVTDEEHRPVISYIEAVQEPSTTCFLQTQPMGEFEPGVGFKDWVQLGAILPNFIQPPYSGRRKLEARLFLVNSRMVPEFVGGYSADIRDAEIFAIEKFNFEYDFEEKGYLESSEDQKKARVAAVKIAMAVAMSDGSLDETEGFAIKEWIKKSIAGFTEDRQKELKEQFNQAMKESFKQAKQGKLSLSKLTKELNELDETKIKYDAISLCFEVMAADGKAEKEELDTIRKVAEALDLDPDEIAKMRDQKLIGLDFTKEQSSLEDLLGIDPSWDKKKIKAHLTGEFTKWSNRMNSLPQGKDREFAQKMLDNIAKARKKYA